MRHLLRIASIVALSVVTLRGSAAGQTPLTLTVQGDRFLKNGTGKFLVFVSYFDGIRRPEALYDTDFAYLAAKGIDGIRVLPMYERTLMTATGFLDATNPNSDLSRLLKLVDKAKQYGLMVDISFSRDTICPGTKPVDPNSCGFTVPYFKWGQDGNNGVKGVTAALSGKRNVIFDLQNEYNLRAYGMSESDLSDIRAMIKATDPTRLVIVSKSQDAPAAEAVAITKAVNLDAVTYHDPRTGTWYDDTDDVVGSVKTSLALAPARTGPIYLQEPTRFGLDNDSSHYATAVKNAKLAGAAAWTFHTTAGHNLQGTTAFESLLQAGERTVLTDLYRTSSGGTDLDHVQWGTQWGATSPVFFTGSDFDRDGRLDLGWQSNDTGGLAAWLMGNVAQTWTRTAGPWFTPSSVPIAWKIVGSGDADRDGYADLYWHNTGTGELLIWYMNGTVQRASVNLNPNTVTGSWKIRAIGDLDGDHIPDLVWQDTVGGSVITWLMSDPPPPGAPNGSVRKSSLSLYPQPVDVNWHVVGTGDLDKDGKVDLFWQHRPSGQVIAWLMNGTTFRASQFITAIDPSWQVNGVGDANGDGYPDLLWQNQVTNEVATWLLDRGAVLKTAYLNPGTVPAGWQIVTPR